MVGTTPRLTTTSMPEVRDAALALIDALHESQAARALFPWQ
jgi:hypothetical protein